MIVPNPTGAATAQGNLLEPFAWALFQIRVALDEAPSGRSPRWVRIARGREIGSDLPTAKVITKAVEVLVDFIAALHGLALALEDLLLTIDPGKALIELLLEMGKAATAPELGAALSTLLDEPDIAAEFAKANNALREPDTFLDYIPEPGDVAAIGRQIFELLCVDPFPGEGAAGVPFTGRVRLLAWAYGLPVAVRVTPLKGPSTSVPVAKAGLRSRELRARDEPKLCLGTWPVTGTPNKEMFALNVGEGEDLDEVVTLLDALGYTAPAVSKGQTFVTGPLTVRLQVFQHLNDLPVSGHLDPDTLFRLLNLDLAQRNIARARPYDPARWAVIAPAPPPHQDVITVVQIERVFVPHVMPEAPLDHGSIALVNPDADHYQDEGIGLKVYPGKVRTGQRVPCDYYLCAAPAGEVEATFPPRVERGWIQHRADDDWLFQEKERRPPALGCCFVGMQSRKLSGKDAKSFEGGAYSEGEAFLPGKDGVSFFFSAREVEPWIAGRTGDPGGDRLFRDPKWPLGSVSGMYQWAPLGDVVEKTGKNQRLYIQAMCARRSLYKERGVGRLPDQGRIVLGLVRTGAIPAELGYGARFKASYLGAWAWSGWWPQELQADLEGSGTLYQRGSEWIQIATPGILVTGGYSGIFVGLYGKHNANLDTDAYFDDVRVRWWRERVPELPASAATSTSTTTPPPREGT